MISRILSLRAALIGMAIFAACLILPPQTTEYLRSLQNSGMSDHHVVWTVIWPALLVSFSLVVALQFAPSRASSDADAKVQVLPIELFAAVLPPLATAAAVVLAEPRAGADQSTSSVYIAIACVLSSLVASAVVRCFLPGAISWVARSPSGSLRFKSGVAAALACVLIGSLVLPYQSPSLLVDVTRELGPLGLIALFVSAFTVALAQGWKLRCEQRSQRYTTEWGELLKV